MQIAIFDTETTGLLLSEPADIKLQPYIIEFSGVVINEDFTLLRELETFIRPPFKTLPEEITKITGIKSEQLENEPPFLAVYPLLAYFFTGIDILVAHNLPFDKGMLANELTRIEKLTQFPWPRHNICTVEKTFHINGYRLNLQRLHAEMTGSGFKDAHRAKNDVYALVRSFHGMVEKGIVNLEDYER